MPLTILFISGKPRAGKDTTALYIQKHAADHGLRCVHRSTIDPVNHILSHLGWDGVTKDATYRAAAASLLDFMVEHDVDASINPIDIVCRAIVRDNADVVTIQTRQPYLKELITTKLAKYTHRPLRTYQVYVDRDVEDFDNSADGSVHELRDEADFVVDNTTAKSALDRQAKRIVKAILCQAHA